MPIRPFGQTPQLQRSYSHVPQSENLDAEGRQQPADLPVLSLIENDLKPAVRVPRRRIVTLLEKRNSPFAAVVPVLIRRIGTTPTNSVYGAMQDGYYVERVDQKISPRPSFPKRGITISPKGGIRGILRIVGVELDFYRRSGQLERDMSFRHGFGDQGYPRPSGCRW